MIEVIVKRNGNKEEFNPKKLNGWGIWASKALGNYVDWSEVVLHVASTLSTEVTSEKLQQSLIDFCLSKSSWSYNRMAGRLYAALLYKQLYNDNIPTVKDLFGKMVNEGVMDNKFYTAFTDEDYKQLESVIDHKRDLNYAHYQINQSVKKYALMNRSVSINYETPQFSMLRTAMRMCMNKGVGVERIARIKRHYDQYSKDKVNVPTPYYTNSGTPKNGFQSCCLHHTNNTVGSLSASDHISYMMTVSSAGQGNKIYTQSIGSAVRGGTIIHQGKTPYYRAQVAMINANLQNGRGGAETQSYDVYDPEIESIQKMKNPMTPTARQVRGLDYAMCFNTFFAKKAANNEPYALFDYKDTEDLYKAMALEDVTVFEKLYSNYIALGKAIKVVRARDILYGALSEAVETGRHYLTNLTEMNRHTPFKESIVLSNLCCVAEDQMVVTNKGIKTVEQLFNESEDLVLFDGKNTVTSSPMKYVKDAEVIKINLKNGMSHKVTLDHRLMTKNGVMYAKDLVIGDKVVFQTQKGLFGNNNMEDEAFLLGLYQADGTQHNGSIHLCVWEDDFDLLEEVQDRFERVHYKYGCDTYSIVNQTKKVVGTRKREPTKFMDSCVREGSKKKKSLVSRTLKKALDFKKGEVPDWILTSDEATQWQYLRGLFYADGSASYNKTYKNVQVSLVSIDKTWLEKLQILFCNLGVNMSIYLHSKAGESLLPDGKGGKKFYDTKESHRLVSGSLAVANIFEQKIGLFSRKGYAIPESKYAVKNSSSIVSIESLGVNRTYCVEVYTEDHLWVCNGIITHNCEISLPTKAYDSVDQLYEEKESGEVAMCSLAGINVGRINSDEEYKEAAWVALDMIHTGITESDYILPQVGFTAKKRMSAGVGIVDLAYAMAKRKLKYSSQEGRDFIHETAESHYWFLLDASLELAKEFGNAEWIDRTKWVDGWLPLDTYNKNINSVVTVENKRDWEAMRKRIKDNKGHAFSVLAAHMPAESSSIKSGATNSLYPVRDLDLTKSNDTNVVTYVVPESEKFGKHYEIAWDIDVEDMAKVYGIVQKWTDQAISADMWYSAVGSNKISSDDLMRGFFSWIKYGVKTRYYVNTKTAKGIDLNSSEPVESNGEFQPESNSECEGCQL